ncbi:LacI family DNA-binding transcriptional regulator [Croceicoccus marinus]|uniref:LacI family DNA-binding transcriptional regulator n=1 Tax=Croceicoccus marinus TaxID=450378 RepID=A0A7G6W186_9SPHN|nr:LacI family DNA-binding transcriptional regulator [Croceicoccus marinus]QNE07751.1 LacI family DNA-binding transcriptional regulator [Croceicoccus marinus]
MVVRKEIKKLADIAELAGVTAATVSRALSGHAQISPETRRRVLEIANTHGFRVNQAARNLRLGRTQSIGVIIPLGHESAQRVSDPFYTALIGRLMDGLAQRDHAMLLSAVNPHDPAWLENLTRSGRVDGVIVLCQSDQEAALRQVGRSYKPLIVWGETAGVDGDYCCVGTDNGRGGRLATEHLLQAGRRQIAFAGMTDIPELAARHAGYLEAHRAHGVAPGPHIPVPLSFDPRWSSLEHVLAANLGIDGVVAASDVIAMGVIRGIVQSGRRVPEDIPVVGYDDVTLAAHIMPALTTIRQDLGIAAEVMLDLLFRRIAGEETGSVRLPLELIQRQSA